MSDFVHRFFDRTRLKEGEVRRQAIELLAQAGQRDDGNRASQLRLPQNKAQHRDEQVHISDPE
jgi:transcription initiation factor TFIIIB Brf1 subunit/transcription initiation factor TFIIB